MIQITRKIMTNSDCYKSGKKITPKGIVFHTTATPGVMAADWFSRWNVAGVDKGVHFFVDDKSIYQYLPCEKGDVHRAWHVGVGSKGSYNSSHISVEMCEPKDKLNQKDYFEKAYANMLDLFTYLCKTFDLPSESIVGHCEANALGYASNHADPNHYIPKMGKTLDEFRAEVKNRLNKTTEDAKKAEETQKELYRVRLSAKDDKNQLGAFTDLVNAKELADKSPDYAVYDNDGKLVYKYAAPTVKLKTVDEKVAELEKTVDCLLVRIKKLENK